MKNSYSAEHLANVYNIIWRAKEVTGDNLKVVWAQFSTLSCAVYVMSVTCTPASRVENSAHVKSC